MNKLQKTESGFSAFELIIIVAVIAILGVVGSAVYKNHDTTSVATVTANKASTARQGTTNDPYSGWLTYTSSYQNISFQYPSNWILTKTTNGSNYKATNVQLTSPSNYSLAYTDYATQTGGGNCNGSADVQLTSVQALDIINAPAPVYLVSSGAQVGLYATYGAIAKPMVGDSGDCIFNPTLDTTVYPAHASNSGDYMAFSTLNSGYGGNGFTPGAPAAISAARIQDVVTAKQILESFKYNKQ